MPTIMIPPEVLEECCQLVEQLKANGQAMDTVSVEDPMRINLLCSVASDIRTELVGIFIGLLVGHGLVKPLVD